MRGMLTTGLIVVILAGVVNIFLGASALGFAVAAAALLLFSGFVLYDTSNIIRRYPTNEYVAGALDLYLDAFNIFLALLRLLNAGDRKSTRLNSSHANISYAVFCLKKKTQSS